MKAFYVLFLVSVTTVFSQHTKKNELLLPYRDGNLWGLCDTLGAVKVKPFTAGMVDFVITPPDFKGKYVIKKNGKISIIDQYRKKLLAEMNLDSVRMSLFSNDIFAYKNNKMGVIRDFNVFIPVEYDEVSSVSNESYQVRKGTKKGLINSKGKWIIPIEYSAIDWPWEQNKDENNDKFYWIAKDEKSYWEGKGVDFTDDRVVAKELPEWYNAPVIRSIHTTESEREAKQNNYKRIENTYGEIVSVSGNMIIIKMKEGYGVYAMDKDKIIFKSDDKIEMVRSNQGYATFLMKKNGKMGLIDETGKVLLAYEYDAIKERWDGICILEKDTKKGLFVLNSIYKPVKPKYKKIKILNAIPVNKHWQFGLFEVTTEAGKKGLLGENGVEYFKN
ncbi:WG repeat-containing protein [Flavobacterium sp. WV_118_3]|uniref:WG repeat-containing protein n=1 Tax=Flavobacterium sp. WV_118_3 TaxID=3151764 RepID=UPI00321B6E97